MIKNVIVEGKQISWTTKFYKKIVVNALNEIVASTYTDTMLMFVEQDANEIATLSIYNEDGTLLKNVTDNEKYQVGSIGTEMNNTRLYIVIYENGTNPYCYYYNKSDNSFEAAHSVY